MKFSELFDIEHADVSGWFDPILSLDTPLFIDPFLLYASETGNFKGGHNEIVGFFNAVFKLVARSGAKRDSLLWRRATQLLLFPEAEELCLGYTGSGTRGAGSGAQLGAVIAEALWEAIRAGVKEITHFEEIGILREGIGADRISDITANILRWRLANFTQEVCRSHHIPVEKVRYIRGVFDLASERWIPLEIELPRNPYNGKPILLVPKRYLRDLPTIDAYDFWEYCYSNENQALRDEFGQDITRHVDKKTIISFARRHIEIRREYMSVAEGRPARPYNFTRDDQGLYRWYQATFLYCLRNPRSLGAASETGFVGFLDAVIDEFRQYVEQNRGWELLWNEGDGPRKESASQNLFLGIVKHYCRANDIDVSREADIGRGPVDFKFSKGFAHRALVEVKKADNTRFWNGLERQLPTYMKAEGVQIGYLLAVAFSEEDLKRIMDIQARVSRVARDTALRLRSVTVDARRPLSASKL